MDVDGRDRYEAEGAEAANGRVTKNRYGYGLDR